MRPTGVWVNFTEVLTTAPAADQPWLREIMLAGVTLYLNEERRTMNGALAEYADEVMSNSNSVCKIFVFRNLTRFTTTPGYDHDKLVKQIREANHAFLKKRGWLQITVG